MAAKIRVAFRVSAGRMLRFEMTARAERNADARLATGEAHSGRHCLVVASSSREGGTTRSASREPVGDSPSGPKKPVIAGR
jgi:hypothetical protein